MFPGLGHRVAFSFAGAAADATAVVKRGRRQLFIVPWRGRSVIGTAHFPLRGEPGRFAPSEDLIREFLDEINGGWPGRPFPRDAVALVHAGLLPDEPKEGVAAVRLLKHPKVIDHAADGAPGIVSAASVKFTTGRWLAERAVDVACRRLGRPAAPCRTALTPLPGARFESLESLRAAAEREVGSDLDAAALEMLVRTYGARYRGIVAYRGALPDWNEPVLKGEPVIRAALVHGAREEMGCTPEDLVFRRTELGARGLAAPEAMRAAQEALRAASAAAAVPGGGSR
jgi:glycerol-3-phosphate dehydrogenase